MIRIALCDDSEVTLEKLGSIISNSFMNYTDDFELKCLSNGILLMNEHRHEPFDIIFLDIDMPKMTGFDVARSLRDDFSRCFIIFVTSHSELVYESMDFQPFNFIRKNCCIPIEHSVENIVKKLMRHMRQNEKIILEDDISGRCVVYFREIAYIESSRHYVLYYPVNRDLPIKMRGSINECEEKYKEYDFVRIHKRYLVNLRFMSDFDESNNEIVVGKINKKLPMSKNYKKSVEQKYLFYLRAMT